MAEHNVLEYLVLAIVSSLMGLQQKDFELFFTQKEGKGTYLNDRFIAEYQVLRSIHQIQAGNLNVFGSFKDLLDFDCNKTFILINDSLTYQTSKKENISFMDLQSILCSHFNIF